MNPRSITKNRKRFSILSVFALLVSLLGATLAVPAKAAPVELTYWSFHYLKATTQATEKIVADWNKANPNVQVKLVYVDVNNYLDKLTTSFAGGTAPDVFTSEAASILSYSKSGYLADLTREMKNLKSDLPSGLWKVSSYGGRLYGVPMMTQTYTVFANVDKFKKAGIAIPTKSLTWDELRELGKKLTTKDEYAMGWGLRQPAATFMIMGTNFGGTFFRGLTSTGGAQLRITDKEIEVPVRVHQMIYEDKSIDPASILLGGGGNIAPFIAGKYSMLVGASYVASDLDVAAKEKGLNWTSLPLPTGSVSNQQGANPQTLSVSATSKYKKESAAFIRYMMGANNLTSLALAEALIPSTNASAKAALAIKKDSAGWTQLLNDASAFTVAPFVLVPAYQKWKDTVAQPTWQQWVQGKITKAEMIKRLSDGWKNLR
jgi:ABC-type glycerol-3-phosphate transport system substrate-binding protein